ncbi:MAG: hypothetical protein V1780_01120 [Chloroflexota bacterium]
MKSIKVVLVFINGLVVGGLLLLSGQLLFVPKPVQSENQLASDNLAQTDFDLTSLVPDIEQIYREALNSPLVEARQKINDPDIARYYDGLLQKMGIPIPPDDAPPPAAG